MTDLLYSLMNATDHLMEEGTSDELDWGSATGTCDDIDGFQTYSTIQPDLQTVSEEAKLPQRRESLTSKARSPKRWNTILAGGNLFDLYK